jgi:hypothetical protein
VRQQASSRSCRSDSIRIRSPRFDSVAKFDAISSRSRASDHSDNSTAFGLITQDHRQRGPVAWRRLHDWSGPLHLSRATGDTFRV